MQLIPKVTIVFSLLNRKRKLFFVQEFINKFEISSCLVVGAAQTNSEGYGNLIERGILEYCQKVTISGLEKEGIGWDSWVSCDGRSLPFEKNEFDLVFSNAVIEHVGDFHDQLKFVLEHARVGKHWILTTPNRLFPIESHTQIFFKHMLRSWSNPLVSRLLSKADLRKLLPSDAVIKGGRFSPTFIAYCGCRFSKRND